MQFSHKYLEQGAPSGTHLLNQWQRENVHVQAYPIGHLYMVMDKDLFLFTYLMHNNQLSFEALRFSS